MAVFFVYSLKVALCLVAFFLVYKLFLSKGSFYRFNHVLLLTMIAGSFILPIISLSFTDTNTLSKGVVEMEAIVLQGEIVKDIDTPTVLSWLQVLFVIYIIGVVLLLLVNILSVFHIMSFISKVGESVDYDGLKILVVNRDISPFSWFRYVVVSSNDYYSGSEEIILHEKAHACLGHSYEVMLCNALIVFQWYNPAAWLLKRELQDIHEYEADAAVLREGVDPKQYQMLLIVKSVGERAFLLANNLNNNSLKKRIKMMKTTKTNHWQCLKSLAVLPVAVCAVVAFANPVVEHATKEIESSVDETLVVAELQKNEMSLLQVKGKDNKVVEGDSSSFQVKGKFEKVYQVVDEMPSFPGGTVAMYKFMCDNVRYPETAHKNNVEGRVIVNFVIDKEGNIVEPTIVGSVSPDLDKEALRVVAAMPKWMPGKIHGKAVSVKFTVPITFRLNKGSDKKPSADTAEEIKAGNETTESDIDNKAEGVVVRTGIGAKPDDVYYSIDGKTVDYKALESLDPSNIESINVLKDKAALEKIGVKDKSGAVLITLKKK